MTDADALFPRLLAFAGRHGLPIPEDVASYVAGPRVGLFAPPGADGESLCAVLGVSVAIAADSPTAERSLERVSLPILVTPAAAAFGMVETRSMRRLSAQRRPFAVVIDGLRGMNEARRREFLADIERFALAPLRAELYEFPLYLDCSDLAPLRAWIAGTVDVAHARRLSLIATDWLADLRVHVAARVAEERAREVRLARIEWHLAALVEYVRIDVPADEVHGHLAEFAAFYADVLPPLPEGNGLAELEAATKERLEDEREKLTAGELARELEALAEDMP